jgi:hypothetical protein
MYLHLSRAVTIKKQRTFQWFSPVPPQKKLALQHSLVKCVFLPLKMPRRMEWFYKRMVPIRGLRRQVSEKKMECQPLYLCTCSHTNIIYIGEADQSGAYHRLLCSIGCQVQEGIKVKYSGIEVVSGPDLVLKPSFALCSTELKKKFTNPSAVKITGRSSLVLKGEGLTIESLDLDGALVIECEPGTTGVIRNLTVRNDGWVKVHLGDDESCSEVIKMRGYRMNKIETRTIVFKKDGTVEGGYSQEESVVTKDVAPVEPKLTPAAEPTPEVKTRSTPEVKPTQNKPVEKEITSNNNHNNVPKAPIQREVVVDLSKPASTEQKDGNTLCDGCVIL